MTTLISPINNTDSSKYSNIYNPTFEIKTHLPDTKHLDRKMLTSNSYVTLTSFNPSNIQYIRALTVLPMHAARSFTSLFEHLDTCCFDSIDKPLCSDTLEISVNTHSSPTDTHEKSAL